MPIRILLSFSLAIVIAVAFTYGDYVILNDIIPNYGPSWDAYGFLKTIVALSLAGAVVASIYVDGQAGRRLEDVSIAAPNAVLLSYVLASAFVLLFLVSPAAFNWLGLEDNIVEYLSAILSLAGAVFFLGAFVSARRSMMQDRRRSIALVIAPLGALALFLIGMEEISWGQRLFGFATPDSFAANRQGEVNLHNFFTTPVHTVYRVGSWAVLILLPFMVSFGPRLRLFDKFGDVLPPPWVAAMSAPVACFNYNTWPFLPTQVIVFSTILMLLIFCLHARRQGQSEAAKLFGAGIVLMVVAQAVFVFGGDRFLRRWDVTEYQEFFMALGLTAVAWAVRDRLRFRNGSLRSPLSPKALGS